MSEPTNCVLQLYINSDLKKLAKQSGLNLSKEFEEWIRIRLNQQEADKPIIDIDAEIIRHQAEIQKLKSQYELNKEQENKEKEELMVLDGIIDNERDTTKKDHPDKSWEDIAEERINGIIFLFNKKFGKVLNRSNAKDLILKRLKERKLID